MIDLKFDGVSKKYRVPQELDGAGHATRLGRLRKLKRKSDEFWAVRNLSFQVNRGETLGIIGPNGAGKSTVLKLLSKITVPTSGEITINGRLSALIEVGSGFHPELTGRENIYLSGSILGMRRREISEKLNSIIDFADVRRFIDTPVKRYSSGMYVRLGFSIAAHLQPDILLLDEVLAVGDAEFQAKCYDRIRSLKHRGTTIVFISHDLHAVEYLCDRALLLISGETAADGFTTDVIGYYEHAVHGSSGNDSLTPRSEGAHKPIRITGLTFVDQRELEVLRVCTGDQLNARVEFAASEALNDLDFEVFYYSPDGRLHCKFSTSLSTDPLHLNQGKGAVQFSCAELGLQPGLYYADVTIKRRTDGIQIDWQYRLALLRVEEGKCVEGRFYNPHRWRIIQPKAALETDRVLCHDPFELKGSSNQQNANKDWREC